MKIYVRGSIEETIHLSDLIESIDAIIIADNAIDYRMSYINGSEDIDYGLYSDDELLKISEDELPYISDFSTLDRLNQLVRKGKLEYKFSKKQLDILKNQYRVKYVIDRTDIAKILDMLQNCNNIYLSYRTENVDFREYYDLDEQDFLDIIQSLTVDDYYKSTHSKNPNFLGNDLIIFKPKHDFQLFDGTPIYDLEIYLKIDIDQTRENTDKYQKSNKRVVAIISFHD